VLTAAKKAQPVAESDATPEEPEAGNPAEEEETPPSVAESSEDTTGKRIGSGSFGDVYVKWDPKRRAMVAIKAPKTEEAKAMAQMEAVYFGVLGSNPRIVDFLAFEEATGKLTLAYYGRSLERMIEDLDERLLSPVYCHARYVDLFEALVFIHGRGIAHCDLKPANMLVGTEGLKLIDFGCARVIVDGRVDDAAGTLCFYNREKARNWLGECPTFDGQRSDVFAGGLVVDCVEACEPYPDEPLDETTPEEFAAMIADFDFEHQCRCSESLYQPILARILADEDPLSAGDVLRMLKIRTKVAALREQQRLDRI